jgi:threonine/homoserine/homoserine lactone efflux protein
MIDWAGFLVAATLVSLIPGANQLLGLRNAVRYGTVRALTGVLARLAAFVVLIGLVVAGLGAVLATSAAALEVVKWIGVVYLAWLGITSLRSARRNPGPSTPDRPAVMLNEFVVAISNPKALLRPQFTGAGLRLALLGAAYLGIELLVGLGYIAAGRALTEFDTPQSGPIPA